MMKPGLKLLIQWPRFGPYHLARLRAAHAKAKDIDVRLIGLEISSHDKTYLWREERSDDFERHTVFPGFTREDLTTRQLWHGIFHYLTKLRPDVVAINGYSAPDALAILAWCRINKRPAILMTESKADDAPRHKVKEWIKGMMLNQYEACLCGGSPHKAYLEQLGMASSRIFTGYDAVDNEYFWQTAENIRQTPDKYRFLPGLETPTPFFLASARFISRKNLDGLLHAYGEYRKLVSSMGSPFVPWRLIILGDGEERSHLENIIKNDKLAEVTFAGFLQIDEIPAYYALAKVFIHPPHQEQWGLVVNEAMASGLPVLVSQNCGCAPDLIRDGVNGYTFNPKDHEQLANLMLKISTGQVNIAALGIASQQLIKSWGPDKFADGLFSAVKMVFC